MNILHISSYYSRTTLYKKLLIKLKEFNYFQILYTAVRTPADVSKNKIEDEGSFTFIYSLILKPFHRFFYLKKINTVSRDLSKKVNLNKLDLVHAHTLFSDGGVAFKLKRKNDIPYIVAVRNTDINIFFKYFIFLRPFGISILDNAEKIITLNNDYKEYLLKYIPSKKRNDFLAKISVIPNGIDEFWINNRNTIKQRNKTSKFRFLYVGNFLKNKNVALFIKAINIFANNSKEKNFQIDLVGGGGRAGRGSGDPKVDIEIENCKNTKNLEIINHGRQTEKSKLLEFYRNADIFIMPSKRESFGLVYAEAMSQGTPIIYTMGQGISSYFSQGEVGWGINDFTVAQINTGIEFIFANYEEISENCINNIDQFSWEIIANTYNQIYKNIK